MRRARHGWGALLLVGLLAALAYIPSLPGEFHFDDIPVMDSIERHDVSVRELLRWQGDGRPLTYLTLLANYEMAGLDVRVFHATNIVLHLAAVALVFLFTRATLACLEWPAPDMLAAAVAGLFALHPLQTQAVSQVIQRAEVLASGFYVATLLLLLRSEPPSPRGRQAAAYAAALASFLLGLATKPVIVTLPLGYVLHRVFFPRPQAALPWTGMLARAAPLAGAAGYMSWAMIEGAEGRQDLGFGVPLLSPARYALTQLAVVPTYLRMLAWPAGQNIDHDMPLSRGLGDPRTLAGAAALAALVGLGAWLFLGSRSWAAGPRRRAARLASFGLAWFLLLLAPTSSVIPIADVLVEHRVYLASWGIFAGIAALVAAFVADVGPEGRRRAVAAALVIVAGGGLFAVTWRRNELWGSRLALWADAAMKSPDKARARSNHAHALRAAGRPGDAVGEYVVAIGLVGEKRSLLRGLGGALYEMGRVDEARGVFARSLALAPGDAETLNDLAVCLAAQGRLADAEAAARQALASDPRLALAHLTLGNVRLEQGDAPAALRAFAAASALAPSLGTPLLNSALAHAQMGDRRAACAALNGYRRAKKGETPETRRLAGALGCAPR